MKSSEKSATMALSKESVSNKDLLQLESRSTVLEQRLRVCTNGEDVAKREPPLITATPQSSVLGRIKSFLPAMDQANRKLFSDIKERGTEEFNIESISDPEARYVEMDLALGVADLNTPEALAAAELAANGQVLKVDDSAVSSDDSSDSDTDEEDKIGKNDMNSLLDVKRTKENRQVSGSDHEDCQNDESQTKRKKIELL
ncbi:unnamed protein product [Calypogeia fissa]